MCSAAKGRRRVGTALSLCALLCSPVAQAKVHALVVGIDQYAYLPSLRGGVNDARDIASTLQKIPGSEVSLLLDAKADFAAIRDSWFDILERSSPGDTVVFSYAGHGSRVPEQVPGSEADGQDDVFVLSAYADTTGGRQQLIRDNQLFEWFSAAEGLGIQLLFIADSCHSGTMTRAADSRVGQQRTRRAEIDFGAGLAAETVVTFDAKAKSSANIARADLPYLTFLSAGLESQQIPELVIKSLGGEDTTRGALSFVVARALEGEADRNKDGLLSRAELRHYVLENVSVLSERQQTPELSPLSQPDQAILSLGTEPVRVPLADTDLVYRVYAASADAATQADLAEKIPDLRWEPDLSRADLLLDVRSGELLSVAGDLVLSALDIAQPREFVARLRGALDKRTAMLALRGSARRSMLKAKLAPDSKLHALGARIEPAFSGQHGEYLIVVNLAGDGTVQLVYPLADQGDLLRHGKRPWSLALQVAQPLGEDHVLALAFAQHQPELIAAIESLDGSRAPLQLLALLKPALNKAEVEIGIVGMFSRP